MPIADIAKRLSSAPRPSSSEETSDPRGTKSHGQIWKERLDPFQSALTILGFIAAGFWFFTQEFDRPIIKLEIVPSQRQISGNPEELLTVEVRATNIGKIPIDLPNGVLSINTVLPEAPKGKETIADSPLTPGGMHLAPGETSQSPIHTFKIPLGYETLSIRSQYTVPRTFLGHMMSGRTEYDWVEEIIVDVKTPVLKVYPR